MMEMYNTIKDIAFLYQIKCNKYDKEMLTKEFCEMLFDETFKEYQMMNEINRVSCEMTNPLGYE